MERSLKQIISTINDFATAHKGIKQFESKPLTEFTASDYLYPLMWVQIKGITFNPGEARITLNCYFVDMLAPDYANFIKVVSDTLKLSDDFYTYFTDNETDFGFYFSNDAPVTPVQYAFEDNVAGNMIEITVQVGLDRDISDIPI